MQTLAYIRISKDSQDTENQRHTILDYAQKNKIVVDELLEVEISSRKNAKERRIEELTQKLEKGDQLLVVELSRLGRTMLETLNLINQLSEKGIKITFIRQPELSTTGSHNQLLLAIYSYFAESERAYISVRTKDALASLKAKGIKLGRPKGSRNKNGMILDPHKEEIKKMLRLKIPLQSIVKIINPQVGKKLSYSTYRYYVKQHLK